MANTFIARVYLFLLVSRIYKSQLWITQEGYMIENSTLEKYRHPLSGVEFEIEFKTIIIKDEMGIISTENVFYSFNIPDDGEVIEPVDN